MNSDDIRITYIIPARTPMKILISFLQCLLHPRAFLRDVRDVSQPGWERGK